MTGYEFLDSLTRQMLSIAPTLKNEDIFFKIRDSFRNFEIVDSFSQIRKNDKGTGLVLEAMFFNEKIIVDIVVSQTSVYYMTALIKYVNMIDIQTKYIEQENSKGDITIVDNLEFVLSYGEDTPRTLIYTSDLNRLQDFLALRENLLNIIN